MKKKRRGAPDESRKLAPKRGGGDKDSLRKDFS